MQKFRWKTTIFTPNLADSCLPVSPKLTCFHLFFVKQSAHIITLGAIDFVLICKWRSDIYKWFMLRLPNARLTLYSAPRLSNFVFSSANCSWSPVARALASALSAWSTNCSSIFLLFKVCHCLNPASSSPSAMNLLSVTTWIILEAARLAMAAMTAMATKCQELNKF